MQPRSTSVAAFSNGSDSAFLDEADWQALRQHLQEYDEKREVIIKRTRDAQKLAKQAIFSLHRQDADKAATQLQQTEAILTELLPITQQHPTLRQGSFSAAMEEYAEACVFKAWLTERRILRASELPLVEAEEYLGGVLDAAGEVNRYAIQRATVRDTLAVQQCTQLVEGLMGQFLQFDLRNSSLRKKYDGLKYTLKKLENTLYELSLAEAAGRVLGAGGLALPEEADQAGEGSPL